jgi:hypothetical protein
MSDAPRGGLWLGHNLKNMGPFSSKEILVASDTYEGDGNSGPLSGFAPFSSGVFVLEVTDAQAEADDTLDVYIQRLLPNGSYEDFVAFTQVDGDVVEPTVYRADVYAGASAGTFAAAPKDGTLGEASVVDLMWGNTLRVKWKIAGVLAAASSILTPSDQPANNETVTIDGKVYTFKAALSDTDGFVDRGASTAAALQNLCDAINLTGTPGTQYALSTTLHPTVTCSAVSATALTATAKVAGAAGNLIAIAETIDGAWSPIDFLGGGSDAASFTFGVTGMFRV